MNWPILACDYDGTLAHDGVLNESTASALDRYRSAGGTIFMVTGRELPDLQSVCHVLDKFAWIVVENGALLFRPGDGFAELLCEPANARLAQELAQAGVTPLSVGRAIIAIHEPHEKIAMELIRDLGLELQIIFNKGSVMILPSGINKATGLTAVLSRVNAASESVCGVGDAENDHVLLAMCGLGVAVGNAIPKLKEHADITTKGARGEGVTELIDHILSGELDHLKSVKSANLDSPARFA